MPIGLIKAASDAGRLPRTAYPVSSARSLESPSPTGSGCFPQSRRNADRTTRCLMNRLPLAIEPLPDNRSSNSPHETRSRAGLSGCSHSRYRCRAFRTPARSKPLSERSSGTPQWPHRVMPRIPSKRDAVRCPLDGASGVSTNLRKSHSDRANARLLQTDASSPLLGSLTVASAG